MSYSYPDPKQNVWRAPASREHGFERNFGWSTLYPTYGNPYENVAVNVIQSLPHQHPSMPFTSAGYPQVSQWIAEETPDSTSVAVTSNIDTSSRVYQLSSNQAPATKEGREVIHSADGTSGYLQNTRDANLLPESSISMTTGRDLNSLKVDGGCYPRNSFITYPVQPASHSHMGNYSQGVGGLSTRNLEHGTKKKQESWLIEKFLDSVNFHCSENQPNTCSISNVNTDQQPQTIPMHVSAGFRSQPDVQSFVARYSTNSVVSAAVDLENPTKRGKTAGYCWRPPPSNTMMHNTSPKEGEMLVSSSKMKQNEKLQKTESGVDSVMLVAWTEYFRQLYLYNVINQQHNESQSQKVQDVNVGTGLPVDLHKQVAKLGHSVNRSAAPLGKQLQKVFAATSGSGELPAELHVSNEEHRRRYKRQTLHLDSTETVHHPRILEMLCKVCNLMITESFSTHKRRPEHLERKALIHRGCQLCKVKNFQYYQNYAIHMNGKEHKENQMKFHSQDDSVNMIDSTQDKSANPDSSGSPAFYNQNAKPNKNDEMITQSEKIIGIAYQQNAPQKPRIDIKLSPRQPLLGADLTELGLLRKVPERGSAGIKRMAEKPFTSDVIGAVEVDAGEELQKRIKIGNVAELSVGSIPVLPATVNAMVEKARKQLSMQDDLQMVDVDDLSRDSVKDPNTATVVQVESSLLDRKTGIAMTSNGAEAAAVLSVPSEADVGNSTESSAEENNGSTLNQQNEDVFVSVVGFYCKVCRTIYNKEEVSEDQHCQSETHRTNCQAFVHLPLSSSPGQPTSLPLPATCKQPRHSKPDETNVPEKSVTCKSRVVDESHQEVEALKQPVNKEKDLQHLTGQLETGKSSKHLTCVNAYRNIQDGERSNNDLGKFSTSKSDSLSQNSTEISSRRQPKELNSKKLKTTNGSDRLVQETKNEQTLPLHFEKTGSFTKQGLGKRSLLLPKSCIIHINPQESSRDVQKTMEGILDEILSQEKCTDIQTERHEVEKKPQTTSEERVLRSNDISSKKPLVIPRTRNLTRKLVETASVTAITSDTFAPVRVKEEPLETDSPLIQLISIEETNNLNGQTKRVETNGQTLQINRPIQTPVLSTNETLQANESTSCSFNQLSLKQEVETTTESTLHGGTIYKTLAPKSINDSCATGQGNETEGQKNSRTIKMTKSSATPAKNVIESITERSVTVFTDKYPDVKQNRETVMNQGVIQNCEAATNPGVIQDSEKAVVNPGVKLQSDVRDFFENFNADVKNKIDTNKQPRGKLASDGKKPPDNDKTLTINNCVISDKTVTGDKVTNENILAGNTAAPNATVNEVGDRTATNHTTSGAIEKSVTNCKMAADRRTVPKRITDASDKTPTFSLVKGKASTKDGTTQQNVVPAVASYKSVVNKDLVDKTGSKVGNTAAATVGITQLTSNHRNAANVENSKTQDTKSQTINLTVSAQSDKSINKGLSSSSENCQTDSMSESVDTESVGDKTEVPMLSRVDSNMNSFESCMDTKNEIASVVLPESLEKGCTVS